MDTGGLGLLQLLIQAGVPPQALLALLSHQNTLGQPELNSGGGGPGGPVGGTGAVSSGEGTPGVGPTDGTTTGIGALSGPDAAAAFGSGLGNGGAIGQAGQALGLNGTATGIGGKVGLGLMGLMGGFPTAPFSLANTILGGLIKMADAAQRSHGPRGSTPNQADILSGRDEPSDPTAPGLPSGPVGADLSFTGNAVSDPTITDAIDAAVSSAVTGEGTGISGSGEGPGGSAGAPSGGGDSGNPGDY